MAHTNESRIKTRGREKKMGKGKKKTDMEQLRKEIEIGQSRSWGLGRGGGRRLIVYSAI